MSEEFQPGQTVTGLYKTGKYIGELISQNRAGTHFVVKVLAVIKHPTQGDLHSPKSVDVPLFHERRALSFSEKTNIPQTYLKPFDGDIPEYGESLKHALEEQKRELQELDNDWANKSIETLETLEKDYFK
ncbi:kinase [Salipaludibacillus neizhouensis]|uniref:Kinase n=1 Tax=Salipaludibacillus neizhouensis TaxID=885475 RepID=A0A3A9KWU3_9BACI|nr:kinase-associated lipoprotein B [Salipaludibacillus neizhouensis]RKL68966.1 kinase [Salipaludibacillus neizhouensis]